MKKFIPFLVAIPSLFFATSAIAECEDGWCRTGCKDGGCIYLNVVSKNYPYVTFQTTYEGHKSQVDCSQFWLRYIRDDGSYSPWDMKRPSFVDQAKMATACHLMFSAADL